MQHVSQLKALTDYGYVREILDAHTGETVLETYSFHPGNKDRPQDGQTHVYSLVSLPTHEHTLGGHRYRTTHTTHEMLGDVLSTMPPDWQEPSPQQREALCRQYAAGGHQILQLAG